MRFGLFGEKAADGTILDFCPAQRSDERFASPYREWREPFLQTAHGKDAVAELRTLGHYNPELYDQFQEDILFACWCASVYRHQEYKDYSFQRPQKEAEHKQAIKIATALADAVKHLRSPACPTLNADISLILPDADRPSEIVMTSPELADVLEIFEHRFKVQVDAQQLKRNRIACLIYGQPVAANRVPAEDGTEKGLAYELALRIRCFSGNPNDAKLDIGEGQINVEVGDASYDVVASLIAAALRGERLKVPGTHEKEKARLENLVRNFRADYPHSRWGDWYLDTMRLPQPVAILTRSARR